MQQGAAAFAAQREPTEGGISGGEQCRLIVDGERPRQPIGGFPDGCLIIERKGGCNEHLKGIRGLGGAIQGVH
jgi:hypothetical protein